MIKGINIIESYRNHHLHVAFSDTLYRKGFYYSQIHQEEQAMLFKLIDRLSNRAFNTIKWLLTAISGFLTTWAIVILES